MTEVLIVAVLIMTLIAVWLAWKLDAYRNEEAVCRIQWNQLFETYKNQQGQYEELSNAFAAFRRTVEAEGAVNVEVLRLRNANSRLAVELDRAGTMMDLFREELLERDAALLRDVWQKVQQKFVDEHGE